MWVKICANTNLDDALLATQLGADALGFVFAPSPRRVTAEQVAAITTHLPASIEKIGVFQTQVLEEIVSAIRMAGLTGVQLHSSYAPHLIEALTAAFPHLRIIQTTHWNTAPGQPGAPAPEDFYAQLREAPHIAAVLVDSRTATASGGTGIAFDWSAAARSLASLAPTPLIVAGGLHPDNVEQAITILQPWGVDVASGVESHPGRKDREKLAAFLIKARKSQK